MMTPDTLNALLLGIVSGLITTFLLWLINNYWVKTFTPWYEKRVYRGVIIQGTWHLVDETDDDKDADPWGQYEIINLKQIAHRLKGSATLVPKKGTDVGTIGLDVLGDISDRFVSLTLKSPTQSRLSYSVSLLEIVGDGNVLRGSTVIYDVSNEKISAHEVEYTRQ